jgi:hypothetical protein
MVGADSLLVFRANGHDMWATKTFRHWRTPSDRELAEGSWYAAELRADETARTGSRRFVITEACDSEQAARQAAGQA